MAASRDVVIIGGGHNGLVAAAYLARAGLSVLVCERRDIVGGAAVSEHPFGPDYTVTSLSYVVSLLPHDLVSDLRLVSHGYHVYPQGPYFAPRADGRYLRLPHDPAQRRAEIAKFSGSDADRYDAYEAYMGRIGAILGPMLAEIPPRLGSRHPADLLRQGLLMRHLRKVDTRTAVDITRLLTGSIADLLDDYFTSDALRGLLSVSGVIGTWSGPRSAGSAYVTLHHHLGDAGGQAGAWGFPRGGMGGVTAALASAARSFGAEIRTSAPVAQITTAGGRATGVILTSGEEISAATVITTAHPAISFLDLVDPAVLPPEFVADIRGWHSRSGTVKVNLAVDRLPVFASHPRADPQIHGGTIVLAESLDDLETAFQEAAAGQPSALPFADVCIPSVFDDSLAPAGQHVISMFTQWVPHTYAGLCRRCRAHRLCRPGGCPDGRRRSRFRQLGPAPPGHRAAGDAARLRADRRQHLPRRADPRPDVPCAPGGRLRGPAHSGPGALPGRLGDAWRRRGNRHSGQERGTPDTQRSPGRAMAPGAAGDASLNGLVPALLI